MPDNAQTETPKGALLIVPGKVPDTWHWEAKWRSAGAQRKADWGAGPTSSRETRR